MRQPTSLLLVDCRMINGLTLYPAPKSLLPQAGHFQVPRQLKWSLSAKNDLTGDKETVLNTIGKTIDLSWQDDPQAAQLRISLNRAFAAQHYHLKITQDTIELTTSDLSGLCYGLDTLKQLFSADPSRIACLCIEDGPDFQERGYMLDISRCRVPTMASLKELIQLLARLRYNQLQLYTEHTFKFEGHEQVWRDASPLNPEQIQALDVECRAVGIELVPNTNSLGHMERWLCYPEYQHLAESPNGFTAIDGSFRSCGSTLKPDETSVAFMASLYDDMLPNFTSQRFNIGGDEPWELGQGASKARAEKEGVGAVYLDYLLKIHREVSQRGKTMLFWGDIINKHPELIPSVPKNCIALNWGYEADSPHAIELPRFKAAGLQFYVCPGTSSWRSLSGRWSNAQQNLAMSAIEGKKQGALGYLVTDWGDCGHQQMPEISWPGIIAGALYAWSYEANQAISIAEAIDTLILHDSSSGIGTIILQLGQVIDLGIWHYPNATVFQHFLYCDDFSPWFKDKQQPDTTALQKFEAALVDLEAQLLALKRTDLVGQELKLSIAMCRLAVARYAYLTQQPSLDRSTMLELKAEIIETFPVLWLQRSRPGGLDESMDILKAALSFIE